MESIKKPEKKRKKTSKSKGKQKLSTAEEKQKLFSNKIRDTFKRAGFTYLNACGKEFHIGDTNAEIDKIFIHKNIIIICEETTTETPNKIKIHITMKTNKMKTIDENKREFFEWVKKNFNEYLLKNAEFGDYVLKYLYFSKFDTTIRDKRKFSPYTIVEYSTLHYFDKLSKSIKKSARYEFFRFLDLKKSDFDINKNKNKHIVEVKNNKTILYPKTVLGNADFTVISFMMSPGDLIKYGYVLRKDNWEDSIGIYQRLIEPPRIQKIRNFVAHKKNSFYNNIIVALPNDARFTNIDKNSITVEDLEEYEYCGLELPDEFNSICIIDGQHRIYAYHEADDTHETIIKKYRRDRNLLVTGLLFKKDLGERKEKFIQSTVFLEINSNAKSVPQDVILYIKQTKEPFSDEAIARRVIQCLNNEALFKNKFELSLVIKAKIKVASIIKFALRYLVSAGNTGDENSLFKFWLEIDEKNKERFSNKEESALDEYIKFTCSKLNEYFSALAKSRSDEWNNDKSKLLSVISLNGFIIAYRTYLSGLSYDDFKSKDFDFYVERFNELPKDLKFDKEHFPYTSSQYKKFSEYIVDNIFSSK